MALFDLIVLVIIGVALTRGLFIGLIREAFSILALAGACCAALLFTTPVSEWLTEFANLSWSPLFAKIVCGAILVVLVIALVATIGRQVQKGARAAGLGWMDRLGGGVLGAAEGALLSALILVVAAAILGNDHPQLLISRAYNSLEEFRSMTREEPTARSPQFEPNATYTLVSTI